MKVKVEAVSQYGIKVNGGWLSKDKFSQIDLNSVTKGDDVEVELKNDKFITSLKVVGSSLTPNSTNGTTAKPAGSNAGGTTNYRQTDPQTRLEIARGTAVKAVMESPLLAATLQTGDFSEAIGTAKTLMQSLASYILTGDFSLLNTQDKTEAK
jgi:hypothetical protein